MICKCHGIRLIILGIFGNERFSLSQGFIPLLLANGIVYSLERGFGTSHGESKDGRDVPRVGVIS